MIKPYIRKILTMNVQVFFKFTREWYGHTSARCPANCSTIKVKAVPKP